MSSSLARSPQKNPLQRRVLATVFVCAVNPLSSSCHDLAKTASREVPSKRIATNGDNIGSLFHGVTRTEMVEIATTAVVVVATTEMHTLTVDTTRTTSAQRDTHAVPNDIDDQRPTDTILVQADPTTVEQRRDIVARARRNVWRAEWITTKVDCTGVVTGVVIVTTMVWAITVGRVRGIGLRTEEVVMSVGMDEGRQLPSTLL